MRSVPLLLATLALLVIPALGREAPRSPSPEFGPLPGRQVDVARGLDHPWGLAFLPDGRMLVTERRGRLRIVGRDGTLSGPLAGVPPVRAGGQGGLLDVAVGPTFARDRLVYLAFSEPGDGGGGTAVARGRLGERGLEGTQTIWRQQPKVGSSMHWGSRLVFRPDGTLFVTLGDRGARDHAQDLVSTIGKVVRIDPDGTVPRDNPFVGRADGRPETWSYGHRNVQAATLDARGQLWTVEHGARGGDELNTPQPGRNYGWPVITYGVDYSGARIGVGTARPGMEQPVYYWDPVIAPSGATFYDGDAFAAWRGDLLVGSLNPGGLVRLRLREGRVAGESRYVIEPGERVRDVRQGPDGLIYVLTDSPRGRIVRLEPLSSPPGAIHGGPMEFSATMAPMKLRHFLAPLLVLLGVGSALAADERAGAVGRVVAFDREGSYVVVEFPTGRQIVGLDKRDLSRYVPGDEIRVDGFGRPQPRPVAR